MKKRSHRSVFSMLSLILGVALLLEAMPPVGAAPISGPAQVRADPEPGAAGTPRDVPGDWWTAVQEQIHDSEYQVTWQDQTYLPDLPAAYQAPNRAHNLRTYFTPACIRVIPRIGSGDPWELGLALSPAPEVSAAEPAVSGNRVEYLRGGLVEWYVNDASGLQQGFLLPAAPGGADRDIQRPPAIDLALSGDLEPVVALDGTVAEFTTVDGAAVLRYGDLRATDDDGRQLGIRLELLPPTAGSEPRVRIVPDETSAQRPITITARLTGLSDHAPTGLSTDADWTAEGDLAEAEFGYSVSTAGDVNGDGYSDVIIGAPFFDNGDGDAGKVFVYHGSLSGLSAGANWTHASSRIGNRYGISVGVAGDVNGDGYSDVVVGASHHGSPPLYYEEGIAFVYHGSSAGLGPSAELVRGSLSYGHFGISVGTAGDVNGDGYSDIIVGANGGFGRYNEGRAFVYHGSPSGLEAAAAWSAEGDANGDEFGVSVATAGDVNGDGYADVIVGAWKHDGGRTDEGKSYVYLGSAGGLGTEADWTAESNQDEALLGGSVGTAGDVNGDGYSDVIIGAQYYTRQDDHEGMVFVYHGSSSGLGPPGDPINADWDAEGNQAWAVFGTAVGPAGDVNGDGYADVIIGARGYTDGQNNEGRAVVFAGSEQGLSSTVFHWVGEGDQADARFGYAVGTAGDVNGDGYSDVIVGARWFNGGEDKEGRAFVYHGAPDGLWLVPNWTGATHQLGALYGFSVNTAGDVNGDGYADTIVGAPMYDAGEEDAGKAFLYLGGEGGLPSQPDWTATGDLENARFGISVNTAGDVNGDSRTDVIIGASGYANPDVGEGRAYVYYGSGSSGLVHAPAWTAEGNQANARFGRTVGTAGDVNGDGYSDVIIGAPFQYGAPAEQSEGWAYVYHGGREGLGTSAAWRAEGNQGYAWFGHSAGTAGDVNGDGYSDVIVGAPRYDGGHTDEGTAYVYHGGPSGLNPVGDWTAEGTQEFARFGWAVGTAGDVNGDGYSDVIVGAPEYDHGEDDEGRAFVYHGSASGVSGTPFWTAESNQGGARFGWAVGTAGDVNGDGYADVLIGAPYYDNPEVNAGLSSVSLGSDAGLSTAWAWEVGRHETGAEFGYAVGTAGDVNGDGYAEVIVGTPRKDNLAVDEGLAYVYYGNWTKGWSLRPRQVWADGWVTIPPLGLSSTSTDVGLVLTKRMPLGRDPVKLQWQVSPLGVSFGSPGVIDGTSCCWTLPGTEHSPGTIQAAVRDLLPGTPYHWRVRWLYHPGNRLGQPASRWVHMPWNGWNETDFRTRYRFTIYLPLVERDS